MLQDTIAAIATPLGEGGVSVIRISGSDAKDVLQRVFRLPGGKMLLEPEPRYMYFGQVVGEKGEILDEVLAVYMAAPHSFTGEDVAEIHCHGGYVVTKAILNTLLGAGVAMAGPGEFSQRAFINGRLNLTQAEAIIDIIQAKSTAALKISEKQLAGELGRMVLGEADKLLDILAQIEVAVDYPEEEGDIWQQMDLKGKLSASLAVINNLIRGAEEGKIYRDGVATAIVGPANAGKSTLLNSLLQEDRAIVTEIAGTTRDTIEEYYALEGIPFKLIDTAGIRETEDLVEAKGIARSKAALAEADLILLVLDSAADLQPEWRQIIESLQGKPLILLLNKADKQNQLELLQTEVSSKYPWVETLAIAAKTGEGLNHLKALMLSKVQTGKIAHDDLAGLINGRQRGALEQASTHLAEALAAYENGIEGDMISIDIQGAWQALGEITGATAADDIISRVFSRFCLGK